MVQVRTESYTTAHGETFVLYYVNGQLTSTHEVTVTVEMRTWVQRLAEKVGQMVAHEPNLLTWPTSINPYNDAGGHTPPPPPEPMPSFKAGDDVRVKDIGHAWFDRDGKVDKVDESTRKYVVGTTDGDAEVFEEGQLEKR